MPVAKSTRSATKAAAETKAKTPVAATKKSTATKEVEDKSAKKTVKEVASTEAPAKAVKRTKAAAAPEAKAEDKKRSVETEAKAAKPAKKLKTADAKAEQSEAVEKAAPVKGASKAKPSKITEKKAVTVDTSVKPSRNQIELACTALLQHVNEFKKLQESKPKLSLPGVSKEAQTVFVQFTLRKMPEQATKTFKGRPVPLPHPFHRMEDTTICAIVKDKVEAKKWLGDDYEKHGIKKIVSLEQLRTSYKSFEAKRELANQYDVFVADDRIVCMLPKALGKIFYVGSKRPLPIRLAKKEELNGSVTKKIEKAIGSTFFYLSGVSTSVRTGTTDQTASELVDNIEAVINGAVDNVPGKWKGIQSIFIKSEKSAALPIYEAPIPTLQEPLA